MNVDLWTYRARPIRAVDGDTIEVVVDLGMFVHSTQHLRLRDIDAPEIYRGTDDEKARGQDAKEFAEDWLSAALAGGADPWPLLINTYRDRQSFNRYVADVWRADTGMSLAEDLVLAGHAVWV